MRRDLVDRLRKETGLPIEHVEVDEALLGEGLGEKVGG